MLQVVDAMRQTIANYLGGLPPEYFSVEISAKGEDLAQLMYTMMMTGYMFRNVQYKLDLHTNMLPQGQLILLTPPPPPPNRLSPLNSQGEALLRKAASLIKQQALLYS